MQDPVDICLDLGDLSCSRYPAFLDPGFIATVAWELGLVWKNTPLALPNLVACFARQVLRGNLSMPELARLCGSRFTPEAYCTARGKLDIAFLRGLLQRIRRVGDGSPGLWKGHRLWHMDGTGISMPDTPALQQYFGQPSAQKPGCGFPVAHLLCLFDAGTGLLEDCIIAPLRTHDLAGAAQLHDQLGAGDILIGDCAFESYAHLALLIAGGRHGVFPVHQRRLIDFRCKRRRRSRGKKPVSGRAPKAKAQVLYDREVLRKCGSRDHIVRWRKPSSKPSWISQGQYDALPQTIVVRELRRLVQMPDGRKYEITLVTSLLEETLYPAEELLQVLKARWGVEINLRHLKTTMKMDVLRSLTVDGVKRELWMYAIVYNAVRLVMLEAAAKQNVPVDRLSFADALYWVRHGDLARPLPKLQIVPYRPDRVEPRRNKRRNDRYGLLTKPRWTMRKALLRKGVRR